MEVFQKASIKSTGNNIEIYFCGCNINYNNEKYLKYSKRILFKLIEIIII